MDGLSVIAVGQAFEPDSVRQAFQPENVDRCQPGKADLLNALHPRATMLELHSRR